MSQHTPGPWTVVQGNVFDSQSRAVALAVGSGHIHRRASEVREDEANARLIAAAPDLLAACEGALAQLTGPAGVWGDGRGNDGKKTGLSGQEFNALRESRVEAVREALRKAGEL